MFDVSVLAYNIKKHREMKKISQKELAEKIDKHLGKWANEAGIDCKSFIINSKCPRFQSGDGKGMIESTIRGYDLYFICDPGNYSITYNYFGSPNRMSPDDHYQDLKRLIQAASGKAHRINVVMPMIYGGRQHRRSYRESLDCAFALQELVNMGVDSIITFDAHDPRVQNAIPLNTFENVLPTYQFIKALFKSVDDLVIDKDHMMMISPDEGAMNRVVYYANVLGIDMGMFYKRRDYSRIVDGRNPIVAHEFLGSSVEGKDVWIIDDMISSGESMLDTAKMLKERGAKRVFVASTFGLFTNGLEIFDKAYEDGIINRILTTNCIYQTPELLSKPWYVNVDMTKYVALLIESLNHDHSISDLLDPVERIADILEDYKNRHK